MFTLVSTIKQPPRVQLKAVAERILGTHYNVTVIFIGRTRARSLNQTTRGKDYVPNVLSFPLTDTDGEMYICPEVAKKEAANFNLSYRGYITYLCIHGALHLKGYDHGAQMDALEEKYCSEFAVR